MKKMIYEGRQTENISFPLGGIGTGSVGLAGNGSLVDWEIANGPSKGSINCFTHFAVKTEKGGEVIDARVLNGDLTQGYRGQGSGISNRTMAGFPHFRKTTFTGEYPLAKIDFEDEDFPGSASLSAFNPFIPLNSDDSSLPVAMFEFTLTNTTDEALDYTLSAVLHNMRGNSLNKALEDKEVSGVFLTNADNSDESNASFDMTIETPDTEDVFVQEYWFRGMWYDAIEKYWGELTSPGFPAERKYETPGSTTMCGNDHCTLLVKKRVLPGESATYRFVMSWNAPRFSPWWHNCKVKNDKGEEVDAVLTNYYATRFKDSRDSAKYALKNWDRLYADTKKFHDVLFSTTLPDEVIDAISANISILKTETVKRIGEKGDFWGWEGLGDTVGSCEGTCAHVWTYVYSTCFLFPDLERNIRENDYKYNQQENGEVRFRTLLPFGREPGTNRACVDGQMGGVMKVFREWKLCGDDEWLKSIWDKVKLSLEFAWREDNQDKWDLDCDGVLEGRQHHTLDMELFGPSSWLEGMYLGALKAGAIMARHLGYEDDAKKYEELFENGSKWSSKNLFNGKWFFQNLDLNDEAFLHKYTDGTVDLFGGDAFTSYWNAEDREIKYQIGEGSEIDQLLGQWHADILGLGDLFDPDKIDIALKNMYKNNFKKSMRQVANPYRIFCVNDEAGAIMCEWPDGARKPTIPILTSRETMHGFEYSFAGLLISRGFVEEGLEVVRGVRNRYDGAKRNPWNEIECGNNYSRSMSCFALLPIMSGMTFDAVAGHLGFSPIMNRDNFEAFYSSGTSWGTVKITDKKVELTVLGGELKLNTFSCPTEARQVVADGRKIDSTLKGELYTLGETVTVKNTFVIE